MKKKIYSLITVLALIIVTPSCSDFLEEEVKVGAAPELSYATSAGIDGLVASAYSFARGWYGKEAGLGLSEMGTDLFYYGYDNKQKSLNSYNLTAESLDMNTSDNASLDHYWELFFSAVDVCNNVLKYVPLNEILNDTKKSQYLGEAYFLRAFYYWHIVNIWGPVPYNEEAQSYIEYNPDRLPEEQVYSKILADLDNAVTAFETAGYMTKADGRANYWAARALKARVLLYAASWLGPNSITSNTKYSGQNLYTLAQTEAQDVIGSGIAEFYSNYADTWTLNNEDVTSNLEAIWGVTYSSDISTTANCIPKRYRKDTEGEPLDYNSLITRTGYSRGGNAMLLMFVGMWNNGASDLGNNGNETFVRALNEKTFYIEHYVTKEMIRVAEYYSPYSRGFTRYLPSLYLWQLLEKNRDTDQRPEATLLNAYTIAPGLEGSSKNYPNILDTAIFYAPLDGDSPEGISLQAWAKDRYRVQFMANGDIPIYTTMNPATALPTETAKATSSVYGDDRYNSYKIGGWCSFPGIKKFLNDVFDPNYPTHDISKRDAVVIRLAEMYLIKAECQLYTGNGDAMSTINELRKVRAIPGMEDENQLTGTATLETILEERAIELCGEQQRWFDLKRTKTLVNRVKSYNAQAAGQIDEHHLLRPIPQTQIDAVTNYSVTPGSGFWQNPEY
ncbi:RagB/SusD family nutrient uptake outer membrane protein [Geofilum sp. OHC36d9]|uniref:RagB/SusD family nutrient uptake outer membrane protein n=1 Tax=Geofilum sp. OHC36d9 TaxID=3458413 RepID=UPI004034817D